jgi:hypothetical protein
MSTVSLNRQDAFDIAASVLREKNARLRFSAPGNSMTPFILDGDVLEVQPCPANQAQPMDVLLYACPGQKLIAHRLLNIERKRQGVTFVLRGDSRTGAFELVKPEWVLGRVVAVKRRGRWLRIDIPIIQTLARLWVCTPDIFRRVLWWVGGEWLRRWLENYLSTGSIHQNE